LKNLELLHSYPVIAILNCIFSFFIENVQNFEIFFKFAKCHILETKNDKIEIFSR